MEDTRWQYYRGRYISKLVDEATTTAEVYAEKYGDESVKPDEGNLTTNQHAVLEEITASPAGPAGLRGFFRTYPRENQDIAVIGANPRLKLDELVGSDNQDLATELDMRERERRCCQTSYLHKNGGSTTLRRQLARIHEADIIESLPADEELLDEEDRLDEVFTHSSIYLTNYYKLATGDAEQIPSWASEEAFVTEMLEEELEAVAPEVVVTLGSDAWEAVRGDLTPTKETAEFGRESADIGVMDAAGLTFRHTSYEFNPLVVPVMHPTRNPYHGIHRLSEMDSSESTYIG